MDEIVKRKQALTGEVEDNPFKGLRELLMMGCSDKGESIIDGIAKGVVPMVDSTARKIEEQREENE